MNIFCTCGHTGPAENFEHESLQDGHWHCHYCGRTYGHVRTGQVTKTLHREDGPNVLIPETVFIEEASLEKFQEKRKQVQG